VDTSALLSILQLGIDIEDQLTGLVGRFELLIPRAVYDEIEALTKKPPKSRARLARTVLELISTKGWRILDHSPTLQGDQAILELATKLQYPVLTFDLELRRKLRKHGVPVIFLRKKALLFLDGAI